MTDVQLDAAFADMRVTLGLRVDVMVAAAKLRLFDLHRASVLRVYQAWGSHGNNLAGSNWELFLLCVGKDQPFQELFPADWRGELAGAILADRP